MKKLESLKLDKFKKFESKQISDTSRMTGGIVIATKYGGSKATNDAITDCTGSTLWDFGNGKESADIYWC